MPILDPWTWQDQAFEAFTTYWAARTPIAYPNVRFEPASLGNADDLAFVELVVTNDVGGQVPIAGSTLEQPVLRTGNFAVAISVRAGQSTERAYQLAGDVLTWFQRQEAPQTVFSALGVTEVGGDPWWQLNAAARFMYVSDRAA